MSWTEIVPMLVVLAALGAFWRDLGTRIDRLNDRLDRHLEGHPK